MIEGFEKAGTYTDTMQFFEEVGKYINPTLDNFMDLVKLIRNENPILVLLGIIGFRKLVSNTKTAPIQSMIDANLLPDILLMLQRKDHPRIQFEALWTLKNIASGKHAHAHDLMEKGGI